MGNKKILITLTTSNKHWKSRLEEIEKLKLKEISLFLTCLDKKEREDLYGLLEKTSLKDIPHVHLRDDMALEEVDFLVSKFNTKVFNIHPEKFYPMQHDLSKHGNKIFVENSGSIPTRQEIEKNGGICVDFSHLESFLKTKDDPEYDNFVRYMNEYKIGCGHISAIKNKPLKDNVDPGTPGRMAYDSHNMENLSDFDYMKKYKKYIPQFCAIELENTIAEQLEVKKYLEKLIKN